MFSGFGKNKEVFTVSNLVAESTNQNTNSLATAPSDNTALQQNIVDLKNLPEDPSQIKIKKDTQSFLGAQAGTWSKAKIQQRAQELLKIPDSEVAIPEWVYLEVKDTKFKEKVEHDFLKRRRCFLDALAQGLNIFFSTDFDGTTAYKNPNKVANSRSIASKRDIWALRTFALAMGKLGYFEVNTARPGAFASPSLVSPEGKGGYRTFEEISGIPEEFGIFNLENKENKTILEKLVINGLSGGVTHAPGQSLRIHEKTKQYGELLQFINKLSIPGAEQGFLKKVEDIIANKEENLPLRILETKAIPDAFRYIPDLNLIDYNRYMDVVKKSREESWEAARFKNEVLKIGINFPESLRQILESGDKQTEQKLTALMREGTTVCLTPHTLDADNVNRSDKKQELYQALADFLRHPSTKQWALENYGISPDEDLFTINGKDVSHIKDFINLPGYKDFHQFVDDVNNNGQIKKSGIVNVVENKQPYCEFSPKVEKDSTLPNYMEAVNSKACVIAAGDSPGSDSALLAQALINGGYAYKVRGLMENTDIARKIVDLLADEKNIGHPLCLENLGSNNYKLIGPGDNELYTGDIKTKAEWVEIFAHRYEDRILTADNIHLNNAYNVAITNEFFSKDDSFNREFNPDAAWSKDVDANANTRILTTADIGIRDRMAEFPTPQKTLPDRLGFITKIPLIGPAISYLAAIENSRPVFNTLLRVVYSSLVGAGAIGTVAKFTGNSDLVHYMKLVQRFAYGLNNFASGIGRGLRKSMQYPGQFIGEMVALVANFFPLDSYTHKILLAFSNGILQMGRAHEISMRENYNLDSFRKGTEKEVDDAFGKHKDGYGNIRKVAADLTKYRMGWADRFDKVFGLLPVVGRFISESLADAILSVRMFFQSIKVPALTKGLFKNMFGITGIPKMSKNSGREYRNIHSPAHGYNLTGVLTLFSGLTSVMIHKFTKNKFLDWIFTTVTNIIPTFGMMTAARGVQQDTQGHQRMFTDVKRKDVTFVAEKSGSYQAKGSLGQMIMSFFLKSDIGQLLFNSATGLYLKGINEELKVDLEDSAINIGRRQRGGAPFAFKEVGDESKPKWLSEFVRKFKEGK